MELFYTVLILTSICGESDSYYIPLIRRLKRQQDGDTEVPPSTGVQNPFQSGSNPFQGSSASNGAPDWPFVNQFNHGMDILAKPVTSLTGTLNIPLKEWGGVWDMKGHLNGGPTHTWYNYGHVLTPVNPNHIPPETIAQWSQSPQFQAARANTSSIPVATLPTGWQPLNCKPPLCNPFVHTFDTAVEVMPSSARWFDGGLDFPIPDMNGVPGEGTRFPLSGSLFAGRQPISMAYGQAISPIDPFKNYYKRPGAKQPLGSRIDPSGTDQNLSPTDDSSSGNDQMTKVVRQWQRGVAQNRARDCGSRQAPGSSASLTPDSVPLIKPPPIPLGQ